MTASTVDQVLEALGPSCRGDGRRTRLLGQSALNGIDFVEFETAPGGPHVLHVHFLNDLPGDAFGLPSDPARLRVLGGTRITPVAVEKAQVESAKVLKVSVDRQGDFSRYALALGWTRDEDGVWRFAFAGIDRLFSIAPVNFRPGCEVDFDCLPVDACEPEPLPEPALDYLAKDYASFRRMLLDLLAQRNPAWTERSAADLGMALIELFAYEGDHLSYFQDAVANEAFLDTARQRASAKRHAKLVDYPMHDGRNAWTYVHFTAAAGPKTQLGPGAQLVTRINAPLRWDRVPGVTPPPQRTRPPGAELHTVTDADYRTDPALAAVRVFETATTVAVDALHNELRIHTWGEEECTLPHGATSAHVYAVDGATAKAPTLTPGEYLLLEEVRGPVSGAPADADPAHRQVVLLERVAATSDPLFLAELDPGTHEPKPAGTGVKLPLAEVTWRRADALAFALCLSVTPPDGKPRRGISVARGNIALADHGRTVTGEGYAFADTLTGASTFRLRLAQGPLTMQSEPDADPAAYPPVRERPHLDADVRAARPAVALRTRRAGAVTGSWWPVGDLLSSTDLHSHFVADVDDAGRAVLRFGDGEYGARLAGVDEVEASYRVGNGSAGNIGADALAHVVKPDTPTGWPTLTAVRNPLAARGGVDPELIEEVRQYAPARFRAIQERAVTEADYRDASLRIPGVAGAVARFRWTGSWYTAFVGIDPEDPNDVEADARGITRLTTAFRGRVHAALSRHRLAGYDLEIRAARYVPIDIAVFVCARPGYFRGDVAHAVAQALGPQGLFDPVRRTFGEPVHLSRVYEAAERVEGLDSATVTTFRRHDAAPAGELETGRIAIGPWEIARLDDDRSSMENGSLTITAGGGS